MRAYVMVLLFVCLCFSPAFAQENTLQELLDSQVKPTDNGMVILVRVGDETVSAHAGLADLEKGTPIQTTDAFRIASVTKTFVATIMLQLQDEDVLSLDDPILQWLPESEIGTLPYVDEISIRQVLNMTSGIFNYVEGDDYAEASMTSHDWTAKDVIPFILSGEPDFAPGQGYHYSNSNYILAQLIIENATGHTLSEELDARIFKPLGMTHTFLESASEVGKSIIQGYSDEDEDGKLENVTYYNDGLGLGDGGIISTVEDLALFAHELIASHSLFSDEAWQEMTTMVDNGGSGYGLGLYALEIGGATFLGHDGATAGFLTQMFVDADDDITIVMFTNNYSSDLLSSAMEEVAAWVLAQKEAAETE